MAIRLIGGLRGGRARLGRRRRAALTLGTIADQRYRRAVPTELVGDVIWPADNEYDSCRGLFNAMIDRRPLAVLRCHDSSDVGHGIAYARRHHLPLSVRGGGHNVAGNACVTTAWCWTCLR